MFHLYMFLSLFKKYLFLYCNSNGGDFPGVVFDAMMTLATADPLYIRFGAASSDLYSCEAALLKISKHRIICMRRRCAKFTWEGTKQCRVKPS